MKDSLRDLLGLHAEALVECTYREQFDQLSIRHQIVARVVCKGIAITHFEKTEEVIGELELSKIVGESLYGFVLAADAATGQKAKDLSTILLRMAISGNQPPLGDNEKEMMNHQFLRLVNKLGQEFIDLPVNCQLALVADSIRTAHASFDTRSSEDYVAEIKKAGVRAYSLSILRSAIITN